MGKKRWVFLVLLVVTLLGLYWRMFKYDFIWDDSIYFKNGVLFHENRPLSDAFKYGYFRDQLGAGKNDFYFRPLLTLSFMLENQLWGLHPFSTRLVNLMLYLIAIMILYTFFKRQKEGPYFAEVATLLFALCPLNVDNIVWVVGRGDLLLLFFSAFALLFLEEATQKGKPFLLLFSSSAFLLGVYSKESTLFFFPIFFIYEWVRNKRITLLYHSANLLIALSSFIVKSKVLGLRTLSPALSPYLISNIKTGFSTIGYYFRSVVFPFHFDPFLPLADIRKLSYYLAGIFAVIILGYIAAKAIKGKNLVTPLALIAIFGGTHVLLAFTPIFPFKIYSRYMMLPFLGAAWIIALYLSRAKESVRNLTLLAVLVLFIPSIILNSYAYRNELSFWDRAARSAPQSGYVLFQKARYFHEQKDFLSSELSLNKALSLNIEKETAVLVSLLYADLEIKRADYTSALKWLKSLKDFENLTQFMVTPLIRYNIALREAIILESSGAPGSARELLENNIASFPEIKDSYNELLNLYLGQNQWEQAERLESILKKRFLPASSRTDNSMTLQIKREFDKSSPEDQAQFYIRFRNFAKAVELLSKKPNPDLKDKLILAKVLYWADRAVEARRNIEEIAQDGSGGIRTLNAIGFLYLNDLYRVREAVELFKSSLALDPAQGQIAFIVDNLEKQYLSKIRGVWEQPKSSVLELGGTGNADPGAVPVD